MKNRILKAITGLAIIAYFAASSANTVSWIAIAVCAASALWILVFSYANGYLDITPRRKGGKSNGFRESRNH